MINVEKLEIFLVNSRTKGYLSYLFLFNTVFEFFARVRRQKAKQYKLVKEKVNVPLLGDVILFIKVPGMWA